MHVKVYTGSYIVDNREGPHVAFDVKQAWVDTHNKGDHFDLCFPFQTSEDLDKLREKLRPLLGMEEVEAKWFLQGCVELYIPPTWRVVFGE